MTAPDSRPETRPVKPSSVELVERVFSRLAATYCAEWVRSIAGVPISDVKTAWAHELSGFLATREAMRAVAWALENLPEKVPNAITFRNLCRQAPAAPVALLDGPRADPAHVAAELAKLAPARAAQEPVRPKDWARRIIALAVSPFPFANRVRSSAPSPPWLWRKAVRAWASNSWL